MCHPKWECLIIAFFREKSKLRNQSPKFGRVASGYGSKAASLGVSGLGMHIMTAFSWSQLCCSGHRQARILAGRPWQDRLFVNSPLPQPFLCSEFHREDFFFSPVLKGNHLKEVVCQAPMSQKALQEAAWHPGSPLRQ